MHPSWGALLMCTETDVGGMDLVRHSSPSFRVESAWPLPIRQVAYHQTPSSSTSPLRVYVSIRERGRTPLAAGMAGSAHSRPSINMLAPPPRRQCDHLSWSEGSSCPSVGQCRQPGAKGLPAGQPIISDAPMKIP